MLDYFFCDDMAYKENSTCTEDGSKKIVDDFNTVKRLSENPPNFIGSNNILCKENMGHFPESNMGHKYFLLESKSLARDSFHCELFPKAFKGLNSRYFTSTVSTSRIYQIKNLFKNAQIFFKIGKRNKNIY